MVGDFGDGPINGLISLLIAVLKMLRYLAWELFFERIGWFFGWSFLRAISIGRYPEVSLSDQDNVSLSFSLFVEILGIGVICCLIAVLVVFK